MNHNILKYQLALAILPTLCLQLTHLTACAQTPTTAKPPTAAEINAAKQAWQKQRDAALKNDALAKIPDIPDLPSYPRKTKFAGGVVYPVNGPSYFFQFTAMEEAKPIIDWYKSAFASNNWTIDRSNASTIMAKKPASSTNCVITVKKAIDGQGRTTVAIHYTTGHQTESQ